MIRVLVPVAALLLATVILLTGQGLQGTLVPLRGGIEGFSDFQIGLLGSTYFAGMALGCLLAPRLVRRVGHIRCFSAFAALASATPLLQILIIDPWIWAILRILTGLCFAGIFTVIESWLNDRATNSTRGGIMSTYTAINLVGLIGGQALLSLGDPAGFELFVLISIVLSVALVPVALTSTTQPAPVLVVKIDLVHLFQMAPAALFGVFSVGLLLGALWSLAPIFAQALGMSIDGVALFMTAFIIGGAVAQWPLGRMSDFFDRRQVLVFGFIMTFIAGAALAVAASGKGPEWTQGQTALLAAAILAGAFTLTLYPICVAHLSDYISSEEFVRASSSLLLLYGVGAALGPIAASLLIASVGQQGLGLFLAAVAVPSILFIYWRIRLRTAIAPEDRADFVAVPRSFSPEAFALDPRSPDEAYGPPTEEDIAAADLADDVPGEPDAPPEEPRPEST